MLGWQFQQKRKETLSLTLLHNISPCFPGEEREETIEFTLQNINPDAGAYAWQTESFYSQGSKVAHKMGIYRCKETHTSRSSFEEDQEFWTFKNMFHTPLGDPARTSFFLTDRGYKAAEHAMERAKVVLAKSARCLEVSFEGSWEALKGVTTDTSITLSDPRLPGGRVKGKVVKYSLIAKGMTGERFGRVTLLCTLDSQKIEPEKIERKVFPSYAFEGYCEDLYQIHEGIIQQTPTGLSYFRYDDQLPPEGGEERPLLKGIELVNGPQDQEAEMLRYAYQSPSAVKKAMARKPTQLRLFFKDLRTKERLEHVISVRMATSWSAGK